MLRSLEGSTPTVPESAFVSEMAYLVGDVAIGERASVWPFVCMRGDYGPITVGDETNVQDYTMLHEATIGSGVTVGHGVVVDGAVVEDDCLVGISSCILQGATVETGCLVAANSVVMEGQTVTEGHLAYGSPAETKPLTDEQREHADAIREAYLENQARYKQEGGLEA